MSIDVQNSKSLPFRVRVIEKGVCKTVGYFPTFDMAVNAQNDYIEDRDYNGVHTWVLNMWNAGMTFTQIEKMLHLKPGTAYSRLRTLRKRRPEINYG